jgi:hypothetical protein
MERRKIKLTPLQDKNIKNKLKQERARKLIKKVVYDRNTTADEKIRIVTQILKR